MFVNGPQVVRSLTQDNLVSFPFFAAFNSLLNNMELMKKIYMQASRGIPNVEITKDEFLHSGQMISHVTPLQVDILFGLSQCINESPTIILSDLQSIAPEQYYIKVEDRILDIKAVSCREERGLLVELMESAYRFSLGWIAGGIMNIHSLLQARESGSMWLLSHFSSRNLYICGLK